MHGTSQDLILVKQSKMSRVFDQGGHVVSPSNPVKKLVTKTKIFNIDSGDRDVVKYSSNGDFVVYLPRVYENVVKLRLQGAEIPADPATAYITPSGVTTSGVTAIGTPLYFLIDIQGLNRTDECSVGADRSGFPDGYFAKIPFQFGISNANFYSDKSQPDNIAKFYPPIGKLDRLHIRTRLHSQKAGNPTTGNIIQWTSGEYALTLEIDYIDNSFDDFSSFETRITERA